MTTSKYSPSDLPVLIAAAAVTLALHGLIIMLGLGMLHHDLPGVPALGFAASVGAALVLNSAGQLFHEEKK